MAYVGNAAANKVLLSTTSGPVYSQASYPSTATGDGTIIIASSGDWTASAFAYPLAVGDAGNVIASDGNNFVSVPAPFLPNAHVNISDDFFSMALSGLIGISDQTWTLGSGIAWPQSGVEAGHPGVLANPAVGAGAFADLILRTTTGGIILGGGTLTATWIFKIVNLSDGTNRYTLRIGLGTTAGADQVNGLYFEYTDNVNSGNWDYKSANASTRTTENSIVPVATGWHKVEIVVDAAASTVNFRLDGSSLGADIATNIPTAAIAPFIDVLRVAGTVAAGSILIDLMSFSYNLTTPR